MERAYDVIVERTEDGFSAYVPDLPVCCAVADSESKVLRDVQTSAELYAGELKAEGRPLPDARPLRLARVTVAA